jgi:sec-independent protein translocase protein TatB
VSFLGVGYQEMLLVLVLLLVVVGPERLPGVAYQIGRAVREMQKYARTVRNEFKDEISFVEEQYKVVKGEVETTRSALREQQAQFQAEMREAAAPLQEVPALLSTSLPSNVLSINGSTPGAGSTGDSEATSRADETAVPPSVQAAPAPPLVF